jgi:hypothetical protein
MNHYFSKHFIAYYWYGTDNTRNLSKQLTVVDGLGCDEHPSASDRKLFGLLSKQYLTLPDLLAFDFYVAHRDELGSEIQRKRPFLCRACKGIRALPRGGWDLSRFNVTAIKPLHSSDMFIIQGMAFEIISITKKRLDRIRILEYTGKNFIKKIKKIIAENVVYCQATPNGFYWGVRTYLERKRLKRWRKIPSPVHRKVFRVTG